MTQNKIKLEIRQSNNLLFFMEGIKIIHSDAGTQTLAEQLFDIERAINNDNTMMRCHISMNSIELVEPRTGKGSLD